MRARQAATHSYVGYDAGIARLRDRVDAALQRVTIVMARQGHAIETVAIDQLRTRRERLVAQQTQARYAVADSYDRARRSAARRRPGNEPPDRTARSRCRLRWRQAAPPSPQKSTLAELHSIEPDAAEVPVTEGLEQAMQGYRRFLDETPETELTPEAMRRLADLQIEKQFGINGDGRDRRDGGAGARRDHHERRRRGTHGSGRGRRDPRVRAGVRSAHDRGDGPAGACRSRSLRTRPAALEAIALYDRLLAEYPAYEHNDQVLYQKARAYDELGRTEEAMETMQSLIATYPHSAHYDEVQFRRGEYFFTRRKFREAESAYAAIIGLGPDSSYYEFALYKLGWSLYKQEFYDEAQHRYMALLDYKVSTGYDFDAGARGRRRAAHRGHVPRHQPRLLEPRRAGSRARVLRGKRAAATTKTASTRNLGEFYLDEASLPRRGQDLPACSSRSTRSPLVAAFQHARDRDLTRASFPKLVLEAEEGVRRRPTACRRSTGATSTCSSRPRCSAT